MPEGQREGEWKQKQRRRSPEEVAAGMKLRKTRQLARRAAISLPGIVERFEWGSADMWEASGSLPSTPLAEARAVVALFEPDDIVWCGKFSQSIAADEAAEVRRERPDWFELVKNSFRPAREWLAMCDLGVLPGPRICPSAMKAGSISRSNAAAAHRRFLVVEHDDMPLASQGAVLRWMREEAGLRLRAVVFTGRKSLHGWFECPREASELEDMMTTLCGVVGKSEDGKRVMVDGFGYDPQSFLPSQPFRLPGWKHDKTGKMVRLLFLG
jgi:hypothetical protein